jgi:hypothetical protein
LSRGSQHGCSSLKVMMEYSDCLPQFSEIFEFDV